MHVYWAFEERSTFKWSKSNLQNQGPRMDAIDFELNVLDRVWKFRIVLNGIVKLDNCGINRARVSTPGPHLPTQASVEYPLPRAPDTSTFRMGKSVHLGEGHNLSDKSQVFCLSDNWLRMISPSRYYIN